MHDNYHLDVEKKFRCEDSSLIHIPILFKWIVIERIEPIIYSKVRNLGLG